MSLISSEIFPWWVQSNPECNQLIASLLLPILFPTLSHFSLFLFFSRMYLLWLRKETLECFVVFSQYHLSPHLVQLGNDSLTEQEGTIRSKLEKHLLLAWTSQGILWKLFALGWRQVAAVGRSVEGEKKTQVASWAAPEGKGVCSWKLVLQIPSRLSGSPLCWERQLHVGVWSWKRKSSLSLNFSCFLP